VVPEVAGSNPVFHPKQKEGVSKGHLLFLYVHFFLFVQKETNQRKRAPEMITSAFFGKMPMASRSQKRLKFAPFPGCHRTFLLEIIVNN
jgi:hypothetical protein